MKNDPVVAIAGVTGAVGAEFIATKVKRWLAQTRIAGFFDDRAVSRLGEITEAPAAGARFQPIRSG